MPITGALSGLVRSLSNDNDTILALNEIVHLHILMAVLGTLEKKEFRIMPAQKSRSLLAIFENMASLPRGNADREAHGVVHRHLRDGARA